MLEATSATNHSSCSLTSSWLIFNSLSDWQYSWFIGKSSISVIYCTYSYLCLYTHMSTQLLINYSVLAFFQLNQSHLIFTGSVLPISLEVQKDTRWTTSICLCSVQGILKPTLCTALSGYDWWMVYVLPVQYNWWYM